MNYYPHHIGDFNNATRHLTRVERSLYRELIELYYDTEQPLPASDFPALCKRVLAHSLEEREAVSAVLSEFFVKEGDVYRHLRCDAEIASYRAKLDVAVRAGRASALARSNKGSTTVKRTVNARSTGVQPTNNQEPRTNNQKRVEAPQRSRGSRLPTDWLPSDDLKAWAAKERPDLDLPLTAEKFRDYWNAVPGSKGIKLDWDATFRNFIRTERPGVSRAVPDYQKLVAMP